MTMDARALKQARMLLGWDLFDLGRRCGLSAQTLRRAEALYPVRPLAAHERHAIRTSLEAAGIVFDAAGPRLAQAQPARPRPEPDF